MVTQKELDKLNSQFKDKTPYEIIKMAFELNNEAVLTTNFRPYEAAILQAVNKHQRTAMWF